MHVLLIDGLNLIRRIHAAAVNAGADGDGVVSSCAASIRKLLASREASHALCVMDGDGPSWRHAEYPEYKANRSPMPADLASILPGIARAFEDLGVRSLSVPGFEADDVIATIALRVADSGGESTIVSTDKAFCQLLRPGIRVLDHFDGRYLDRHHVRARYEVEPGQLNTLFALAGDGSVNVPGVRSIGVRTAAKLIADHGTLEEILAAAPTMDGHVGRKLRAGVADARLAARLLALRADATGGFNLRNFRLPISGV